MYENLKTILSEKGVEASELNILEIIYAYEKDKMEQLKKSNTLQQIHIIKNIKYFDFDKAKKIIEDHFSRTSLSEKSRKNAFVLARRFFIFIALNESEITLKALGVYLAGKGNKPFDHSTILHHRDYFVSEFSTNSKARSSFYFLLKDLNDNGITTNYTEIEVDKIKIIV